MKKVAIIIKYFPANSRISGLTNFIILLLKYLAEDYDLHVYSACSMEVAKKISSKNNYTLHSVKNKFWCNVFRMLKGKYSNIILVSGIYKQLFLIPILFLCIYYLRTKKIHFLQGTVLRGRINFLLANVLKKFKTIITTNRIQSKRFSTTINNDCFYLPPGVDVDFMRYVRSYSKDMPIRIGFINHLNKIKGADIALKAFDQLKFNDTEYIVAGTGELEEHLRFKYSLNHTINFCGFSDNVIALIKSCDFLVLPFRQSNSVLGISQTVLEAVCCGVPVIGSDVDVITAVIEHEKQGLIFKNYKELVNQIKRLHDDQHLRKKMSTEAVKLSTDYNIKDVAKKILKIIGEA